jgi:dimeric dUTPase (all-alpha-NTP-PPase superfamily)
MNPSKLFEAQKILRDRINYNEPDRFNKLILALLVELGECANEWRGFKFWSVNQLPHTSAVRVPAMMDEDKEFYNPLLEEYVDGLHFVLELGIELGFEEHKINAFTPYKNITEQFQDICIQIAFLTHEYRTKRTDIKHTYKTMFNLFLGLGEMLGFTQEQIEQAYYEKNKINHIRQETGY